MSQTFEFYDAQATAAAAQAAEARLDNVRERALRSEKAWRQLADRALKVQRDRIAREETRAAEAGTVREAPPWT